KADGYLVTRLDGVVVGVDVIPLGLGHPTVRGLRNLVEVESTVGRIRRCTVVQDRLGETVNISPGSVTIGFLECPTYLLLVAYVCYVDIPFKTVVETYATRRRYVGHSRQRSVEDTSELELR